MLIRERLHRPHLVGGCRARGSEFAVGRRACGARPPPAREHVREAFDDGLIESRNGLAQRVALRRAVRVELHEADGEQLHELARVVFVGADISRRVRFLIAEHREVHAHHRVQRHVLHQGAEVAECVARQRVVVVGEPERILCERDLRHHHDLRQRPGDALAQLVVAVHDVLEPDVDPLLVQLANLETGRNRIRQRGPHVRQLQRRLRDELLVDPACVFRRVIERTEALRRGLRRAERRLVQEPVRLRIDRRRRCYRGRPVRGRRLDPGPSRRIPAGGKSWL
jgi:hypothetical protein